MARREVIERLKKDFVPLALRAAAVQAPPANAERHLLLGIQRASLAPQGMFVLNSDGQPLTGVLMFDDTNAISKYLQLSMNEFHRHPRADASVQARRFVKFPSQEAPASVKLPVSPEFLLGCNGDACGAAVDPLYEGSLTMDVVARSIDSDGKLSADTLHQEHYSQDDFLVSEYFEHAVTQAARAVAGKQSARLPDEFVQLLMAHAYLGHIDVSPVSPGHDGTVDLRKHQLEIHPVANKPGLFSVSGTSGACAQNKGRIADGASFRNEVILDWRGYLQIADNRISSLDLIAEGIQDLRWRSEIPVNLSSDQLVGMLPAGKPLSLRQKIVVGFTARPRKPKIALRNH